MLADQDIRHPKHLALLQCLVPAVGRTGRSPPLHLLPGLLPQIATGTANIPSFTSVPPSKRAGQVVQYGPYDDTPPLTLKPIAGGALLPAHPSCSHPWHMLPHQGSAA